MGNIITLTTDFDTKDPYVAVMKGVVLSINHEAHIVDITHKVPPQDIRSGAATIGESYKWFAPGTVHMGVVDPGVGTSRRAVVIETRDYLFVGPDNGLFTLALRNEEVKGITALTNRKYFLESISPTFHGRDIFAPVAAHLSLGVRPEFMGEPVEDPCVLDLKGPLVTKDLVRGEVMHIDSFGNLITNIREQDLKGLDGTAMVVIGERRIKGVSRTYGGTNRGALVAVISSCGYLEIAANMADASRTLGQAVGGEVSVLAVRD